MNEIPYAASKRAHRVIEVAPRGEPVLQRVSGVAWRMSRLARAMIDADQVVFGHGAGPTHSLISPAGALTDYAAMSWNATDCG